MNRSLCFILVGLITSSVFAQSAPVGLASLSEDRLLNELANRRLTVLLDHAFSVDKTPKDKRDGVMTLIALQQLADPAEKLNRKERQEVIHKVIAGIEQALPNMTDGTTLMQQAKTIIAAGTDPHLNTLEYWGTNPAKMAELKPIAETVSKIYAKAVAEYQKQETDLANKINSPTDPRLEQVEKIGQLIVLAQFSSKMFDYTLATSMDPANPARAKIIDEAIKYLKQWDNADSQVQPVVKNATAKFHMLKGDFETAKKVFDEVINDKGGLIPAPNIYQRYEARYFSAQCDVLAGKLDAAQKGITDLETWEKASLPKDPAAQKGAAAALSMLQFRLHSKAAELAKTDAEKEKANDAAIAVLTQLRKDRPDLVSIIDEQVLARLPANPDMSKLDSLLLGAIVSKADAELHQADDQKPDPGVLARGAAAAKEYISRKGKPGIEPRFVDDAAIRLPFFFMKLDKKLEAANSFMDYMQNFGLVNQANGKLALDNAGALLVQIRKDNIVDQEASKAWDRFLGLAINKPYSRVDLAYAYAARLQQLQKYKDAVTYFRLVPSGDPNYLMARYRMMVALKQWMDDEGKKMPIAQRDGIVQEIQGLADEVTRSASAALTNGKDDATKHTAQGMLVRTSLLAADLASRLQNNPQRTLDLLNNFEDRAKGLPNEDDLVPEALLLTVNSQMALGQTGRATKALVELLNRRPGGQGAQIVFNLLQKLNEQYDAAKKDGNQKVLKRLADDRAQLSGFLVDWAKASTKPEIKSQTYVYERFNAGTKHDAAELEPDPAKRNEELKAVLSLFESLKNKENQAAYKASTKNAGDYDAQVDFKLAMIQFDLKNYAAASDILYRLRRDGKLGRPLRQDVQNDQVVMVDNEQYWEATYKELKSMAELAKAGSGKPADIEEAQRFLKRLYVELNNQVGGKLWKSEFEDLRKEMVPGFDPAKLLTPTTQG